jgi:hypothetical protein
MDLALLWFGFLWALLGKGGARSTSPASSPAAPPAAPGPAQPWPAVVPSGLPPWPSGWEYDEPPPAPVVARARQLLSELWARGSGATKTEQTAGRWIVYRSEITRGNKRGVVAYRERGTRATPSLPSAAAPSAAAPAAAASPGAVPISMPAPPRGTVVLRAGRVYRLTVHVLSSQPFLEIDAMLAEIKRGVELGGGTDVVVRRGPPLELEYTMRPSREITLQTGTPITVQWGSLVATIQLAGAVDMTPAAPPSAPPAARSAVDLPILRRGAGMPPAEPSSDVRTLQARLGIAVDGRFGAGTEAAVKAFQRRRSLTADGVVGPNTWTALFASNRA